MRSVQTTMAADHVKSDLFSLISSNGKLTCNGVTLDLDEEGHSVLNVLLERRGECITEAELFIVLKRDHDDAARRLWKKVSCINNVLATLGPAAGYIMYFPDLGYVFKECNASDRLFGNIGKANAVIGRSEEIRQVAAKLPQRRFMTIVGAGGIGKTTLMTAVCATVAPTYPDGIRILDLAPLSDSELLPVALASALDMPVSHLPVYEGLRPFLRGKQMLIILDSCEHLISAAACAAEALLRAAPGVHVLATSREPLLADGESLHHLNPMELPPAGVVLNAHQAVAYSAVQLFVDRARQASGTYPFEFTDSVSEIICEICRKLDGLPLALELAAAWFRSFGPEQFVANLNVRLLKPTNEVRNAVTRHLNLAATLDWSYDLLPEHQQCLLRRIAVFRGSFTMDSVIAMAAFGELDQDQTTDDFLELISKSFISLCGEEGAHRHRLLDTTRAYCLDKLDSSDEVNEVHHRHIVYLCEMLEASTEVWVRTTRAEWLAEYAPWVDDVRAALDRAFGPAGDRSLGVRLTVVSCALGNQPSLMLEFGVRVNAALAALSKLSVPNSQWEVALCCFRAHAQLGGSVDLDQVIETLERFMGMARENDLPKFQTTPLCGLWGTAVLCGDFPKAVEISHKLCAIGIEYNDPCIHLIGQRMLAQASQFMGWHNQSRICAQSALDESWRRIPLEYFSASIEISTSMRIMQARMLWQTGSADSAVRMGEEAIRYANDDVPVALCQVIGMATLPVAIWRGDYVAAHEMLAMLEERVDRYGMVHWRVWADYYAAVLASVGGDDDLLNQVDGRNAGKSFTYQRDHLPTLLPRLWSDETLDRVNAGKVGWCGPEIYRLFGERLRNTTGPEADAKAEVMLLRARALAQQQQALGWELRCAISLADLMRDQERLDDACLFLMPVLARFTEGHDTMDLVKAKTMLEKLRA